MTSNARAEVLNSSNRTNPPPTPFASLSLAMGSALDNQMPALSLLLIFQPGVHAPFYV